MIESISDPRVFIPMAIVVGLSIGSFLNVVIHRLPIILERDWQAQCAELRGEAAPASEPLGLAFPGSHCPRCNAPIRPIDNIPLLSYAWLRGRCRACGAMISLRYPVVEALTGVLTVFAAWRFGLSLQLAGACLFIWAVLALAIIDLDTQLLPDAITMPLLWCGLLLNLWGVFTDLRSAVIGAIAGYLALWAVYWLFKLATGKEGMGYGDFKLLGAIGAWLGWQVLPVVVLLSSVVGAAVGIGLIVLARRGRNVPIPFGPYLAAAGALSLFWGRPLIEAWLRLI